MRLPVMPPVAPMLAKSVPAIPAGPLCFEPKWDGFRALIFRDGAEVEIGSRNGKPLTRYFPELVAALKDNLPDRCVLDGEIVLAVGGRLEFEVLQQRIHPAASRVALLAEETPAGFVAFDLLASGSEDHTRKPFSERRALLEEVLAASRPPIYLTPATENSEVAKRWFAEFEGAGLDGIVAKPLDGTYAPNKRAMFKIKHERTADCVVAGYRPHKSDDASIGSLLLGLYSGDGGLAAVGVVSAFPAARRKELFAELQPLVTAPDDHPWSPAREPGGGRTPLDAEGSRWSGGKDLSFVALRPERVVEVRYDHLEGDRFRHTAQFSRWRPDRDPASCTYAQLEEALTFDLTEFLTNRPRRSATDSGSGTAQGDSDTAE
ncbi:ATP-dependent DNA ligase [Arthrobacter sp. Br18]|uniref:ATP-dependent DNA ligase n=1 Tax=Arthrobacter sp. Br18 TaxID=1312954 RepID=UPI0004B2AB11|nr:ATP-dependent DNA ligase [Arthrobacter sp. Br18]